MSETFKEFQRGLHCSATNFDELASWHWRLKGEYDALVNEANESNELLLDRNTKMMAANQRLTDEMEALCGEVTALRDELQMALFDFGMKQKDINIILAACVQDRREP